MFTAKQLKERMEQKPFRPFRLRMSNGESYDIPNHDAAWVLRDSVEIGLDPDAEGFVSYSEPMTQKIGHIALVVRDYDEAIAFYTKALGFTLVEDTCYGNQWDLLQLK